MMSLTTSDPETATMTPGKVKRVMMTLRKEMQDGVQVPKGQLKTLKERRDKKDKADTNTDWEARCSKVRTNTQNCV